MYKLIVICCFVLGANQSFGQVLETDRPDQTESSNTVPKGTFQIESGVGVELSSSEFSNRTNHAFILPSSLFRIAVGNKFELRVVNTLRLDKTENAFYQTITNWQIDDLQLGFKWKIIEGDDIKPQVSLMSHVVMPTSIQITSPRYGVVNKLLISHSFANGFGLGYNLGYDYLAVGNGDLTYSISLAVPVTEKLGCYIESYGAYANLQNFITSADAGVTYLLKKNVQLDYSFGVGVNHKMNYHAAGITVRLPK